MYRQGWMCLYPVCRNFWKLHDGMSPPSTLEYDCRFLQQGLARQQEEPSCPELLPLELGGSTDKKGWHCESCGRLSCRYKSCRWLSLYNSSAYMHRFKWEQYECSNCQARQIVAVWSHVPYFRMLDNVSYSPSNSQTLPVGPGFEFHVPQSL